MNKELILEKEVKTTSPDYVIHCPKSLEANDAGNQHLLVFRLSENMIAAIWTTHTYEGAGDHHIRFARSVDNGATWNASKVIAGPGVVSLDRQASWGFPMVSRSGRIYVIYNRSVGAGDVDNSNKNVRFGWHYTTGLMEGIYSDDCGETWSKPEVISMPKGPLDNPDPSIPSTWIVWQKPERLNDGRHFVGYTRWVSPSVRHRPHNNSVHAQESVVEFMRFENLDENPCITDLKISFWGWGEKALRVPYFNNPAMSCAQEPSIVKMPDKRLFAVMRTMTGYCWYSIGSECGENWSNPRPLLYRDHGDPVLHPLSPSPIYLLKDGRYALFTHNNDGRVDGQPDPEFGDITKNRAPVYIVYGKYSHKTEQPITFDQPIWFMDNKRGGLTKYNALPLYGSHTNHGDYDVLWYPDAKTFLLGKKII